VTPILFAILGFTACLLGREAPIPMVGWSGAAMLNSNAPTSTRSVSQTQQQHLRRWGIATRFPYSAMKVRKGKRC
jgi:hypothetical protein